MKRQQKITFGEMREVRHGAASTMAGKRSAQAWPLRVKQRTRGPSRRTINRYPSCLISWGQSGPDGGRATFDGRHGSMKPEGRCTIVGGGSMSLFQFFYLCRHIGVSANSVGGILARQDPDIVIRL